MYYKGAHAVGIIKPLGIQNVGEKNIFHMQMFSFGEININKNNDHKQFITAFIYE